jgi:hypothetical protein
MIAVTGNMFTVACMYRIIPKTTQKPDTDISLPITYLKEQTEVFEQAWSNSE